MKNRFFSIALFALVGFSLMTTSCKKKGCMDPNSISYNVDAKKDDGSCQYPAEARKATLIEFTAVWCPPCGSWGTAAFNDMIAQHGPKIVAISSHGSYSQPDVMTNDYSDAFKNNFPITGWPNFRVGNIQKGTSSSIANDLATIFAEPIIANGILNYSIADGKIDVQAGVKFFMDASGEYFLGVYILENGIDGSNNAPTAYDQKGDESTDYLHEHVLRSGAVPAVWGEKIIDGSAINGQSVKKEYSIDVDAGWVADNLHVIGVIWKKNGNNYEYVNAWEGTHTHTEE